QIYAVSADTITVNWVALSSGPGTGTSEGYALVGSSTNFNGTGTIYSSTTFDAAQSTLTLSGLAVSTTYYLRVGGINWNGVANYVTIGSTKTLLGTTPPATPLISAVYLSSITASWGAINSDLGYVVDAS